MMMPSLKAMAPLNFTIPLQDWDDVPLPSTSGAQRLNLGAMIGAYIQEDPLASVEQ